MSTVKGAWGLFSSGLFVGVVKRRMSGLCMFVFMDEWVCGCDRGLDLVGVGSISREGKGGYVLLVIDTVTEIVLL